MRRRAAIAALAIVPALALAPACKDKDRREGRGGAAGAADDPAGMAGSGAGGSGANATPPGEPRGNRAAEPEGPSGEVFHAIDRKTTQGFGRGELAAGGGWIYWIERPRTSAGGRGEDVVRRKPAAQPAATPETVAGPARIQAIAADAERVYVASDVLEARPHAGGAPARIADGAWLEVVPGDRHLLLRTREQVALVPKAGGVIETVWEGKHGKLAVDADGDRFIAIPSSPWQPKAATRAITVFAPGAKPAVLAELAEARGDLAVDGEWLYFSGEAGAAAPPLWRLPRAGGAPARVGDPAWGFGELLVRGGVLYGMIFTGAWRLQKLALAPGAQPVVLEGRVPSMIQALALEGEHLYYLTDFEVKRAAR